MKTIIALSCAVLALAGCVASDRIEAPAPASRAEGAFQFSEANTAIPEATAADGTHAVAGSAGLYQPRGGNRPTQMIVPGNGGTVAPNGIPNQIRSSVKAGPRLHRTTKTGLPCHVGPNGGIYHTSKTGNPEYSGCIY